MELILMRHGKAEERGSKPVDSQRELTDKGRRKVQAAASGLAVCLQAPSSLQIWTSPMLRARQTAEIVADTLGVFSVTDSEAVRMGDLDEILDLWRQSTEQYPLLIVGHEPYLSHWSAHLTGVVLPFKTASAAAFDLEDPGKQQAKLLWYAHAETLSRWGRRK